MKVYLAGPVAHSPDHGQPWRTFVKNRRYDLFDWIDPTEKFGYEKAQEMTPERLVEADKTMIDEADAILVGYEHVVSVGTWREVEYALHRGKSVAIWMGPADGQPDLSPWVQEAGYVSESLHDCLDYLAEMEIDNAR